jgi:hypothetical protein
MPLELSGPRVQIAAGHRDIAVPEGCLHHGQGSAVIDGVDGVRMPRSVC